MFLSKYFHDNGSLIFYLHITVLSQRNVELKSLIFFCFSQSQWKQRLLTSRQANQGSLVRSLSWSWFCQSRCKAMHTHYSCEFQRDCGLWQQVGDAKVEQTNRHWRPTHHTFHHPGHLLSSKHSAPNLFIFYRRRTSLGAGLTLSSRTTTTVPPP